MKKIQVFIDHDIIIRHFIHSNVFSELEKAFEVQYVFADYAKRIKTDISKLYLKSVTTISVDGVRSAKLRQLAKIQSLKIARKNSSYEFVANTWRKFFGFKVYAIMWVQSLPVIYDLYRRYVIRSAGRYKELESVIRDFEPDVIIHPSVLEGVFISDLALITSERNIPFIALMNSWDNPSTKAQAVKTPDWLCVWGEQTKRHAVEFMGMASERVNIMGAAQFEAYRCAPSKTKEELCYEMGVDPAKKLILYAGSSKSVNEMKHLMLLEEAVQSGDLKSCHIVFRPHPWRAPAEGEADFYAIDWNHVSMDPAMKDFYNSPKNKRSTNINLTDYMDTHNILSAIDLLISNMSTIILEAALHGKPVLCMISDKDMEHNNFLNMAVNSLYFKELLEKIDLPRCRDEKRIGNYCLQQLELGKAPDFRRIQCEKARFFVNMGDRPYPIKLRNFIKDILSV